jgi:hypothetical protein
MRSRRAPALAKKSAPEKRSTATPSTRAVSDQRSRLAKCAVPGTRPSSTVCGDAHQIDETNRRHEDDRGQRGHGQVGHRAGQEEQDQQHRSRRDESRELRSRTSSLRCAGARRACADRVAADEAACQIGASQRHQLAVRIGLLAVSLAEAPTGGGRVGEAQEGQADGARQQRDRLVDTQRRHAEGREAAPDRAQDLDAERLEVKGIARHQGHDEGQQGHRQPRQQPAADEHGEDDEHAEDDRRQIQVVGADGQDERVEHHPRLEHGPDAADHAQQVRERRVAQDLGDLTDGDIDADTGQVADEDRLRQQVGEETERCEAHRHEDQADQQGQACGQADAFVRRQRERRDGGADERRRGGVRSDDQPP